jgi:hypothetical protein
VLGIIQLSIKVFWCSEEWVVGLMKILYCRSGVMAGQLALIAGNNPFSRQGEIYKRQYSYVTELSKGTVLLEHNKINLLISFSNRES